jgi:ArsR family transcriptional regulator
MVKETAPSCQAGDHADVPEEPGVNRSAALARAAQLFRAMGDAPRLRILEMLSHRERCVTEIVQTLGEKFSTVSQRLRVLRTERLIVRRRQGTHVFYALADRHVADLIHNALAHADEEARPPDADKEGDPS